MAHHLLGMRDCIVVVLPDRPLRAHLCRPSRQVSPRRDIPVMSTAIAYLHRLIGFAVIHSPLVPANDANESRPHDPPVSLRLRHRLQMDPSDACSPRRSGQSNARHSGNGHSGHRPRKAAPGQCCPFATCAVRGGKELSSWLLLLGFQAPRLTAPGQWLRGERCQRSGLAPPADDSSQGSKRGQSDALCCGADDQGHRRSRAAAWQDRQNTPSLAAGQRRRRTRVRYRPLGPDAHDHDDRRGGFHRPPADARGPARQ